MANEFDPAAYGFQNVGDGRLFIPFDATGAVKKENNFIRDGGETVANPNAGKYALSTPGAETGNTNVQYFDNTSDLFNAYNQADRSGNGVKGVPDLSNIIYKEAGTNNPSNFAYNYKDMTPEQLSQVAGNYNGQNGYFIDPGRLGYIEQHPGPTSWTSFRDGPLPIVASLLGGILAAPEAGAGGAAAGAGGNAAQGLQLTGSTEAAGMGGGTGLTAAGTAGGTGLQLTPATQAALNTSMSTALPNILGTPAVSASPTTVPTNAGAEQGATQNAGQGLQLSPNTQNALGTSPTGLPSSGGGITAPSAPSTPGAPGATPAGGSGTDFVSSIMDQLKKNAIPLGLAGLAASAGSKQSQMPNQSQIQAGGQAANAVGTEFLDAARTGSLLPWQQAGLDQNAQNAKNQINNYFASIGQFDSTARMQALQQVDQQTQVLRGQLLQQTLSSGLQAIGAAQGPLQSVANFQLAQDKQLQDALGGFARSVGSLFGSQAGTAAKPATTGTATATPPATGAAPNTPQQPFIQEQTPQNVMGLS